MGVCWSLREARHYREEKHINGTKPIPRWVSQKIDTQLEQNICKVYVNQNIIGTGFLCKIPYPDEFKLLPVLITNNHILKEEDISLNKKIQFSFGNDKNKRELIIRKEEHIQIMIWILQLLKYFLKKID